MPPLIRSLCALSLALWVGAIFFFALGLAPVAFHVLPSTQEAGLVVGASLIVLHRLGLACAVLYLLTMALCYTTSHRAPSRTLLPSVLVLLMLALTLFSHFIILPRMQADRAAANGSLSNLPLTAPARMDFDRLHHLSEQVEGTVLLLGLAALVLTTAFPFHPAGIATRLRQDSLNQSGS